MKRVCLILLLAACRPTEDQQAMASCKDTAHFVIADRGEAELLSQTVTPSENGWDVSLTFSMGATDITYSCAVVAGDVVLFTERQAQL